MPEAIVDEFTSLPISRQRKYQLRRVRDNRCSECGEPVVCGCLCLKHLVEARERQRKKLGSVKRYRSTLSYQLQNHHGPKVRSAGPRKIVRLAVETPLAIFEETHQA